MKFIHAADIHLDSPLKGLDFYEGAPVDEIRGATRRALVRLVDLALEETVAFVLIGGDLYDGDWKDHNTGLFMVRQMSRLREANIRVFTIRGNHDAENAISKSLKMPSNVTQLSSSKPQTEKLDDWGVAIHGRGFTKTAETDNLVLQYPQGDRALFNVGMLHTSRDGRPGHDRYAPCSIDDLRHKNYQYWALGHIHRRERDNSTEVPIVYPGNIQGRYARETETGPKGCEVVHVDDKLNVRLEFRPLDVLRWEIVPVNCTSARTADDVLDLCRRELQQQLSAADGLPLAARLELVGATRAHAQLLARPADWSQQIRATAIDAGDGQIWIEKVKFHTLAAGALDDGAMEGPIAELVGYLRGLRSNPEQLAELANDLAPLVAKLPGELLTGDDALELDSAGVAKLLSEVEPLLIERLQAEGACP